LGVAGETGSEEEGREEVIGPTATRSNGQLEKDYKRSAAPTMIANRTERAPANLYRAPGPGVEHFGDRIRSWLVGRDREEKRWR
jgi:hypothetical protein